MWLGDQASLHEGDGIELDDESHGCWVGGGQEGSSSDLHSIDFDRSVHLRMAVAYDPLSQL